MPVARKKLSRTGRAPDPRGKTHWEGCEEVHLECALYWLEKARKDLDWHRDVVAECGAAVSLARATLEALENRTLQQDECLQGLIDFEDRLDAPREFDHPEMEDGTLGR